MQHSCLICWNDSKFNNRLHHSNTFSLSFLYFSSFFTTHTHTHTHTRTHTAHTHTHTHTHIHTHTHTHTHAHTHSTLPSSLPSSFPANFSSSLSLIFPLIFSLSNIPPYFYLLCLLHPTHPNPTEPPLLNDAVLITERENVRFRVDLSEGNRPAFPFPSSFTWSRTGGVAVENATGRVYEYPSVTIQSVQPSDTGNYTLTATNSLPDGTPVGTDSGSFSLDVLCEWLSAVLWGLVG